MNNIVDSPKDSSNSNNKNLLTKLMDQYPSLPDKEKLSLTKDIESAIYSVSTAKAIKGGEANEKMDKLIVFPHIDLQQRQQDSPSLELSNATERLKIIQKGFSQLAKEHPESARDVENQIKRRIDIWSKKTPYYQTAKDHSVENPHVEAPKKTISTLQQTSRINNNEKSASPKQHSESASSLWPTSFSQPPKLNKKPVEFLKDKTSDTLIKPNSNIKQPKKSSKLSNKGQNNFIPSLNPMEVVSKIPISPTSQKSSNNIIRRIKRKLTNLIR